MATTKKKAPAGRKTAPKKNAAGSSATKTTHKAGRRSGGRKPDRRTIKSKAVKANNRKFGNIQHEVLDEFYEAGLQNKPRPDVKRTYKKVARRLMK